MRIGILKADTVPPALATEHGQYTDMFPAVLRQADPALEFASYDVEHEQYPRALDECDGYLITGSRHSVYDPIAWIDRLKEWVREAAAARRKVIGVCFGHQLVAHALGGRTELSDRGWTVGVQTYDVEAPFPWTSLADAKLIAPRQVRLAHSNRDQVVALPDGAERVASTSSCPVAMYRIGAHVMCMQGHPEFTPGYAQALYAARRKTLGEALYDAALHSFDAGTDRVEVARWMVDFVRAPSDAAGK